MAENIADYFKDLEIKIEYLHSDIDTVERMELIRGLRQGNFDVLIGMDIIGSGDFAITNHKGKTVFSFRIPSIGRIDFVNPNNTTIFLEEKPEKIQKAPANIKVGRNAPCPCGSGLKYKKCCG